MAEVLIWNGITKHDLPPDRLLESAVGQLESVVIVGFDKDGELYFASSKAGGGDVLWFFEKAKQALLEVSDQDL